MDDRTITRDDLAGALENIQELGTHLAGIPMTKSQRHEIDRSLDAIQDHLGLYDGEFWTCDGCNALLLAGDMAMQDEEGETTRCEECAESYADLAKAAKSNPEYFIDPGEALMFFQGKVDAGEGDKKYVHEL